MANVNENQDAYLGRENDVTEIPEQSQDLSQAQVEQTTLVRDLAGIDLQAKNIKIQLTIETNNKTTGEIANSDTDSDSSSSSSEEETETIGNSSETEESQQQTEIRKELEQPEPNLPLREVNIQLLGETGVGKSTWINAIANYLNYDTLDDAIEAWAVEPMVIIPSQFTMTDDDYKEITVPIGDSDANEVQSSGQSATQHPTTYTFKTRNLLIRIIDTPGIGDTRGIKQDKENFQKIMNHISHVDVIHGICVLLKPNNSRLNIFFEFCVKELITQLHKECTQNIAFCFTNARSTFYRPGDTLAALRTLLKIDNTDYSLIPLEKKTIYCLDNEAFRFLAAVKFGQTFEKKRKGEFR